MWKELKKKGLYFVERLLLIALTAFSITGLFFGGCFAIYKFLGSDALDLSSEAAVLFASILVVAGLFRLLCVVQECELEIEAEELQSAMTEEDIKAQELYEHLTANLR